MRLWLFENPDHAAEFSGGVDVWNDPAQCVRKPIQRSVRPPALFALAAVLVLVALAAVIFYSLQITLSTGKGERLSQTLDDGTRVQLNTDTHIRVRYGTRRREIVLESGEIYFNVVKHEPRPFVVVAGDRKVVATGTSFMVRRDDGSVTPLTVTLLEGVVAIGPNGTGGSLRPRGASETTLLKEGERVRFRRDGPGLLDRPPLDSVTSWRRGQLIFANTPLTEAVAEFNRYSLTRITVRSPEAAAIQIDGTFRTEDSLSFIQAVALAHHMGFEVQGDELILEPAPLGGSLESRESHEKK
jgi:transmembrane sensor